jgi:hypothetical protein
VGHCFVIQPFDRGKFDKRFDDVLAPAIEDAGLTPYRVDRDPGATILIDDIAKQIATSAACLCDITTDNPNVWFELGYAIASHREVILICSDERKTPFPFDVQHRSIIKYSTESPSDFQALRNQIGARLAAMLSKRATMAQIGSITSITRVEGLEQFEVAALVAVAQGMEHPDDGASLHQVRRDMKAAGFTELATTLGLRSLLDHTLVSTLTLHDELTDEPFTGYQPTKDGLRWLFANKARLALRAEPSDRGDSPF